MPQDPGEANRVDTAWERWGEASLVWTPYLFLAASTVFALLDPDDGASERLVTLGLAAIAAAWVYVLFTRSPKPYRDHRARMAVYFVGLMVLASVLMVRNPFFFVFAITGFFHASLLRPWPLTVIGVAATSILINTLITGFPWPTTDLWILYGAIIVIQTVAIGLGTVLGERLSELSEQRREAVTRLEAALQENVGLQRQLVAQAREAGVLDERGRMAREIHDTIAHGLTGIVTQLEAAEGAEARPDDRRRHTDNALRLARESLVEARRSVEASRPEVLEGSSLPEALDEVARRWSALNDIGVEVRITGEPVALHPEIEAALLRTAQEALANVSKHAHASRAGLTLSYMGDVVTLDVRDDGVGFDLVEEPSERPAGFGLTTMRQRVTRVAGTLAIESDPGGGTAISARVPAIAASPGPVAASGPAAGP
jgi:signal transduction histidine kinase